MIEIKIDTEFMKIEPVDPQNRGHHSHYGLEVFYTMKRFETIVGLIKNMIAEGEIIKIDCRDDTIRFEIGKPEELEVHAPMTKGMIPILQLPEYIEENLESIKQMVKVIEEEQ
jgi:hypothetical protein